MNISQYINYVEFFELFILSVAIVVITTFVLPKYFSSINQLRRVAALDGIDGIVRSCAERGRPLHFVLASLLVGDVKFPSTIAVLKTTATTCGDLNVPLLITASDAQAFLAATDTAHQGYLESTHPERYNASNNFFVANIISMHYKTMDLLEERNCGGNMIWGVYPWSTSSAVVLQGRRIGCVQMSAITYSDSLAIVLPWCDYNVIGEEMVAAGAYLTRDPSNTAAIISSDFIKLTLIIMTLVILVRTLAKI